MKLDQGFYKLLFILITIQFLFSFLLLKKEKAIDYYRVNPPGAVRINGNFFCDETEVANIYWAEYVYWVKRVFGDSSKEYIASLPDTLVWRIKPFYLEPLVDLYFRHPAYSYYPAVGITQQQAIAYSKWRSDRVFEGTLIFYGKILKDTNQTIDNYFTIEKYFTGHFKGGIPDTNFAFYPEYRLPTILEWEKIMHYNDSLQKSPCKEFRSDITEHNINELNETPTVSIYYSSCKMKKNKSIYNMRGNVREWTTENYISVGGGWIDKSSIILLQDTFHSEDRDCITGFRNVCEWKRWVK
jgi:formylglycine-generating enzyme required for sulfatase activity